MSFRSNTLTLVTLIMVPVALSAQERVIPLDTVRATATSRAASELVTPARAVEVITAEQIRRAPVSDLAGVLEWALGVDLMQRSPALADVSIRGSSFEQVLVMVDGVRVGDAQTGHFHLNLAVPLAQVERVEVLRGPSSAVHGADAMGGVINVVTRRRGAGIGGRAEVGSFGTRIAALTLAAGGDGLRADAAAEMQTSDGHRPGTDSEVRSARLALRAPVADRLLDLDLATSARDFGADGFYGPFPSYEETRTSTASLRLRPQVTGRWELEPTLSLRSSSDDFILRRHEPEGYRNQHGTLRLGGEMIGRAEPLPGLRLAAGVERFSERLESETLGDRREGSGALLAEVAAGEVGRVTGSAGIRRDWHDAHAPFWSPSAAVAVWPTRGVRVRGSVGRAFRTPSWTERFYRDPANIGDPALRPEVSLSSEIGLSGFHPAGVHGGVSLFRRDARDLIDWAKPIAAAAEEPWRTRNVERARFDGVEAEVGAPLVGTLVSLRGQWLAVRSSAETGYASKYALRPLVESYTLAAHRTFADRLQLTARAHRVRRTDEASHFRLDGRAAVVHGSLRLFADVRNAADAAHMDITGNPAPGRSLHVGIERR
jgi:outer membrane cobalamin receptor